MQMASNLRSLTSKRQQLSWFLSSVTRRFYTAYVNVDIFVLLYECFQTIDVGM